MAKLSRMLLVGVLVLGLAAGPALAGPGKNWNGDPDHPQIANPSDTTRHVGLEGGSGSSLRESTTRAASVEEADGGKFLLEITLKLVRIFLL